MKKILLAIMAFAVLPAFVSANELNTGISLGNSKMGGDLRPADSNLAYSIFSEMNITSLPNLFIGAEVQNLGSVKYESNYGKDVWVIYQYGAYAKLKLFDIPTGLGSFFGNFKLGFGGYSIINDSNNSHYEVADSNGTGYNIGFGAGYMFNQGTSVSLSYTMHKYDQEYDGVSGNCKNKVFGISLSQRFGYTPKRNVRATENNVYEQVEQKASSKNTVIADPCDGLCPKTVPASVLNLNYNNQW